MNEIVSQPFFGVFLTLFIYVYLQKMNRRIKNPLFNPTFISIVLIVILLKLLNIEYKQYNEGGRIISFFLGPATVALAVPIYKEIEKLKNNGVEIILSILVGSFTGILSGIILSIAFGGKKEIVLSIAPKSVTTPIAIEISNAIGGIPSLTVSTVIIAGLVGAVIGPAIMKLINIKSPVAQGLGMGTASHGLGTARAVEEGEIQGAFSGLSIGLAGIFTSILSPIVVWIMNTFMHL